jgi:hypothetical protein
VIINIVKYMVQTSYLLTAHKQLINLNSNLVNFKADMKIVSTNGKSFEALVVTQEHLDSDSPLQYKNINPNEEFNASVSNNNNIRQDYYLILRSLEEASVMVSVDLKALDPPVQPATNVPLESRIPVLEKTSWIKSNWKKIAIVLLLIAGGVFIYFFYKSKQQQQYSIQPHDFLLHAPPRLNKKLGNMGRLQQERPIVEPLVIPPNLPKMDSVKNSPVGGGEKSPDIDPELLAQINSVLG